MSQNSEEEIKTVEKWRWSEMQGLELVSSSSAPISHSHESNPTLEQEEEREMKEEASVAKKDGFFKWWKH